VEYNPIRVSESLNVSPNSLQDALPGLSSFSLHLGLLICELLLVNLMSPAIEVHLSWVNRCRAFFPFPYPEEEGEEREWEVITIAKEVNIHNRCDAPGNRSTYAMRSLVLLEPSIDASPSFTPRKTRMMNSPAIPI